MKYFILIFILQLSFLSLFCQRYVPFKAKSDIYIYVDSSSMNPVSQERYLFASLFNNLGFAIVYKDSKANLVIDKNFKKVWEYETKFHSPECFSLKDYSSNNEAIILPFSKGYKNQENSIYILGKFGKTKNAYSTNLGGERFLDFYKNVFSYNDGMLQVREDGSLKWTFLDMENGREIIDPVFDEARGFQEGLVAVRIGKLWGYFDRNGNEVIHPKYGYAWDFSCGYAHVQNAEATERFFIDKKGNKKNEIPSFDLSMQNYKFHSNLLQVPSVNKLENKFINQSGKIVLIIKQKIQGYFSNDGYIKIEKDGKYGLVNKAGKVILPPIYLAVGSNSEYESFEGFSCGLTKIKTDNGIGFADTTGKVIVRPKYYDAHSYQEGITYAKTLYGWEMIDNLGNKICELNTNESNNLIDFNDGFGIVNGIYIDRKGRLYTEK